MGLFTRFLKQKPQAAPREEVQGSVDHTPKSFREEVKRISSLEELPHYESVVMAAADGTPILDEEQRLHIALLNLGSNGALIIADEEYFGEQPHLALRARALRSGIVLHGSLVCDEPAVLRLLYDKERKRLESDENSAEVKAESIRLFEDIVRAALAERATDIHFKIREDEGTVIFRVDSLLQQYAVDAATKLNEAVGVAYTKMAGETTRSHPAYNPRLDQSCVLVLPYIADTPVQLRYQSVALVGGFDVIIRVLKLADDNKASLSLEQLGYSPAQRKQLELASRKKIGATIIAGVTGSGKTTTLKTLMTMDPNRHRVKSYSVEDPAEYIIPGVSQKSVQRTSDANAEGVSANPFVGAMRVVMRADPDIIMVGEVRDMQTGSLLKAMVQSGHQVFTTVHAASAIEILERLSSEEIGLLRQTLASRNFISALCYQRLLPLNCVHCRLPARGNLEDEYLRYIETKFALNADTFTIASPIGCPACKHHGVKGMTVVAEILTPDIEILKLIREGLDAEAEEVWRRRRTAAFDEPGSEGKTAFEHALYKMSLGLIDPRELEGAIEPFESYRLVDLPTK